MSLSRCCSGIAALEEEVEDGKILYPPDLWSELPEDVKVDILCRMPENDLIQSKLVSKDWNFLISNVCVRIFSPPSPSAPFCGLLLYEEPPDEAADGDDKLNLVVLCMGKYLVRVYATQRLRGKPTIQDNFKASLPTEHDLSDIQDCCNGLLLLASDRRSPTEYYVCNPATKQWIAVPVNPNHYKTDKETHCSLVFDSYNYKIIRFIRSARDATASDPMQLDVFSSDTGVWSSHVVQLEPHNLYGFQWIRRSVYWAGTLYYVSLARYLVCMDMDILTMDSKARAVELPDKDTTDEECGCIGISSGCLYYSNRHSERSAILVWMLVGDRSHWVLMHNMSIGDLVIYPMWEKMFDKYRHSETLRPRGFHPNDDILFMATPGFLLYYHLKTKKNNMCYATMCRKRILLHQNLIFPYSRCLVDLNSFAPSNRGSESLGSTR